MHRISLGWAFGGSFVVVGGLSVSAGVLALAGLEGNLAVDAACLLGPLGGGIVAALAAQRGSIGEIGLGALMALLLSLGLALLFNRTDTLEVFADSASLSRTVRVLALFCVGAMAGAGLGHRAGRVWLAGRRIRAPLFWFLVGGLTTLATMAFAAAFTMHLTEDELSLGLVIFSVGPLFGALIAQQMAPAVRRRSIAAGCAAVPTVLFAMTPDGIAAVGGFPVLWLFGWIGAVIATRLREPPTDQIEIAVPEARVEDQ